MGRLVINELYKIFKKKSIYVLGIITFLFMVLSMFLYKDMSSSDLISSEFNRSVIFVVISIIMISSTIVSDEYNGTIKQLLIKPYKRYEILLSKLISCFIVFVLFFLYYFVLCVVCYGIVSDFKDYMDVIVVNGKSINVLKYVLFTILGSLPEYLIILSVCFCSSVLFNSSSSLVIGFFSYFGGVMLNTLIINNAIKYLYWVPSMCWNLNEYLFGDGFKYCSMRVCLLVDVLVLVLLIVLSFVVFCRKDIKNA